MGYNPDFKLNPKQLDMIEDALRAERGRLAIDGKAVQPGIECSLTAVRQINELLAHLHHQKSWHRPKGPVPMG